MLLAWGFESLYPHQYFYIDMITRYHIIQSYAELKKLVKACIKTGYASVDFETNAQGIYNNAFRPTILSVTFEAGSGVSIPLDHPENPNHSKWLKWLLKFGREVIENPSVTKIGWNWKFDNQIFVRYGIYVRGTVIDGMLAKYVLNEERPNGLKDMVRRYIPEAANYEADKGFDRIPWDQKPLEPLCKYGCQDTDYTFRLAIFMEAKLIELGLYKLYRNLIMPASIVLQSAESKGIYVDREFNSKLLNDYGPRIEAAKEAIFSLPKVKKFNKKFIKAKITSYIAKLQEEISELTDDADANARKIKSREDKISRILAGEFTTKNEQALTNGINLNSNNDLPAIMYGEGGFGFTIIKNTDSGKPSTDEETLNQLRLTVKDPNDPAAIFLDKLLEMRGLEKMYKTFILGWHNEMQDDSRLHGRFNIIGTTSGRLSSDSPNLQQIPKTSVDPNIKNQLVAPKGKLYLAMDFSQAELRIMAHLSGDETYLEAFASGKDPHLAIAAKKYGLSYEDALAIHDDEDHPDHKIWKVRRKQAKQIAFGLIYGIEKYLLAVKLSDPKMGIIVTPDEAQQEKDEFFNDHPKIKKFMDKQSRLLKKQGYLTSLFGRKRRLPQIYSDDKGEVAYAIRMGANFPCQSAASDMTLFGSILLYYQIKSGDFPPMEEIATVHDAVYYYTDPEDINVWTVWKMWETFRNPQTKPYFGFSIDDVAMSMDFSIGRSMAEELPFIPGYDYNKMLDPNFSVEEYMAEYKQKAGTDIEKFPQVYHKLMSQYRKKYGNYKRGQR